MELIKKYFPQLNAKQLEQLEQLGPLYEEWNQKINVISRKDIENLYPHHILHAMALAKIVQFVPNASVLDLGTGGGLPGIPLAILFPETQFTLVDGTRKKITVVSAIAEALRLENVVALHARAEELKQQFDFVVCRAVASIDKLYEWSMPRIKMDPQLHGLPNGLITLKGGAVQKELKALPRKAYSEVYPLSRYFEEPYYEEKCAVYVQR